ncbi:MAG: OmpA family protein [Chitinivibrionales bacterium]|nr:OmpA family protein [Chitinivibrionales bacterium]
MKNRSRQCSTVLSSLVVFAIIASAVGQAQTDVFIESKTNPITSCYATRGLVETSSAEALGVGRLTVNVHGSWYQQQKEFLLAPNYRAHIITGIDAISFGVNNFIDIFGSIATYGSIRYQNPKAGGLGSITGGIQGSLPFPPAAPIRLAGQFMIIGGTASNQINGNYVDGYNYFETRQGYDFIGKLIESFIFGTEEQSFKIHLNEALVTSLQHGKEMLLLLAAGLQGNLHQYVTCGLELNSRTFTQSFNPLEDPFWMTASIQLRTPYATNFYFGGDVSLSQQRQEPAVRSLEPYRLFAGFTFTFDLLAQRRKAAWDKEQQEKLEKAELEARTRQLQMTADSIAEKARQDSLALAQQLASQEEAARRQADSLAQKSKKDSILLAQTMASLQEEKSKRTDMEKQLLSTGLLILDAVFFESGKTEISINSRPYLNIIGKMLLKYPKLQLQVAGHTDNIGNYELNMRLSKARAESVRDYLFNVAPELSSKLFAAGYGPSQPKADNKSAEGRKLNRRVELQVMNKEVLKEYNQ